MPDSSPLITQAIRRAKSRIRVLRIARGTALAAALVAASWTGSRAWDGRYPTQILEVEEALHVLELPEGTTLPELRESATNRLRSETKRLIHVLRVQAKGKGPEAVEARRYLSQLAAYATEED